MPKQLSPRVVPMQVLSLGLSRTGTASMHLALQILLQQDVWHGFYILDWPSETNHVWEEAIDAKFFGKGKPWGRKEFDSLLGTCAAVTDAPCCYFADDLISAYPEAKVIICQRDVEAWYKSFEVIIYEMYAPAANILHDWIEPILGRVTARMARKMVLGYWNVTNAEGIRQNARSVYTEHYDRIRRMVPPEKLLEYKLGTGWRPLCDFLGKDEPDVAFPWINEAEALKKRIWEWEKRSLWTGARQIVKIVVPLLVAALALYWYRR